MRFFRAQTKNIALEQMQSYDSIHSTAEDFENRPGGLAVSRNASGFDGGSRFGGAFDALDDDDEIVVVEGYIVEIIYDRRI